MRCMSSHPVFSASPSTDCWAPAHGVGRIHLCQFNRRESGGLLGVLADVEGICTIKELRILSARSDGMDIALTFPTGNNALGLLLP